MKGHSASQPWSGDKVPLINLLIHGDLSPGWQGSGSFKHLEMILNEVYENEETPADSASHSSCYLKSLVNEASEKAWYLRCVLARWGGLTQRLKKVYAKGNDLQVLPDWLLYA